MAFTERDMDVFSASVTKWQAKAEAESRPFYKKMYQSAADSNLFRIKHGRHATGTEIENGFITAEG